MCRLLHLLLSFLAAQQTQADLPLMFRALICQNVLQSNKAVTYPFYDSDLGVTQHHLVHGGSSSHKHGQDGQKDCVIELGVMCCDPDTDPCTDTVIPQLYILLISTGKLERTE